MLNMDVKFLYSEIKSEVRHADAKLGIRITILSFWITILSLFLNFFKHNYIIIIIIIICIIILIFQVIIASIGIFPKLDNFKKTHNKNECRVKNNYYFKFISSFNTLDGYKKHMSTKFNINGDSELIAQIYTNAKIADRKYKYYSRSSFIWFLFNFIRTALSKQ